MSIIFITHFSARMLGKELVESQYKAPERLRGEKKSPNKVFLQVRSMERKGSISAFDLDICKGEVLGLAGLLGSGRTEIGRLLFGSLIDILNRGAPVMLLYIGMTLVFATGGIDLSVGAVMAISGAIAAVIIRPGYAKGILEYGELVPLYHVIVISLILSIAAGLWNGMLFSYLGIQPIIDNQVS